jgi:hypothetical protein
MIKQLIERYRARNHFDPSSNEFVGSDDLVKVLEGQVSNSHSRDSAYFVICRNGLSALQGDGTIKVGDIPNVIDTIFHRSEWFGRFNAGPGESKIIVPSRYQLFLNIQGKKVFLKPTERASYWSHNLDHDLNTRILRADIGFNELRELVNSSCSGYECGDSLQAWNR